MLGLGLGEILMILVVFAVIAAIIYLLIKSFSKK